MEATLTLLVCLVGCSTPLTKAALPASNSKLGELHLSAAGVQAHQALIPVRINGKGPFLFVLDTGNVAYPALLTPAVAKRLGIDDSKARATYSQSTLGLNATLRPIVVKSLTVGNLSEGPIAAAVSPGLEQQRQRSRLPIDGNLGYQFLKQYVLRLNLRRLTAELTNKPVADHWTSLRVDKHTGFLLVTCGANGQPVNLMLDTGAATTLLTAAAATSLHISLGPQVPLNGVLTGHSRLGLLKTFVAGNQERKYMPVVISDAFNVSGDDGRRVDGILGLDFLAAFEVTIDFPRMRFCLTNLS